MEEKKKAVFSVKDRLLSFKYAFNGLKILLTEEHNARIHFVVAIIAIILGFVLNIAAIEWIIILVFIALVISLEIVNSALESICNYISPQWNQSIKKIKDLAAAAVLIASIIAVICGIIIFIPKLCDFFAI